MLDKNDFYNSMEKDITGILSRCCNDEMKFCEAKKYFETIVNIFYSAGYNKGYQVAFEDCNNIWRETI